MTEIPTLLGSISIDFSIPMALLGIAIQSSRYRRHAVAILGASMPFMVLFIMAFLGDLIFYSSDPGPRFPIFAALGMSLPLFIFSLVLGGLLPLLSWPKSLPGIFVLGMCAGPLVIVTVWLGT